MSKVVFQEGPFSTLFVQFIEYKQSLGFKYGKTTQMSLKRINDRLNNFNLDSPILTKEIVLELAQLQEGEARTTQSKRICFLRHFSEFLNALGIEAYVYPAHYKLIYYDHFTPYIFSHEQIEQIIHHSDCLPYRKNSPFQHIIWPALIRTLYGCGLRLSECLSLKQDHVNLKEGILFIEKSKKGTSRYVPMSETLTNYLNQYASKAASLLEKNNYFFPSYVSSGPYFQTTVRTRIKRLYELANIPLTASSRLPRVHDLRHTFCYHALEAMEEKGYDLYYSLPILSAYVGHQGIRDTERYLHLPEFQYKQLSDVGESILSDIEVMEEDNENA